MKPKEVDIPVLYAYIFRNLEKGNKGIVILNDRAMIILGRIIRKAPRYVYREILEEMCQMHILKRINKVKYMFLTNYKCKKALKKLKEYIFPFSPKV